MQHTKSIFALALILFVAMPLSAQSKMIFVEGGTFLMGSKDGRDNAKDVHSVTVSSFYMSRYKVSLLDWAQVIGTWPINYQNLVWNTPEPQSAYSQIPAFGITWYEAIIYCNKLSVKEGLTPCYASNGSKDAVTNAKLQGKDWSNSTGKTVLTNVTCDWKANGYRLPTEAEWEYAARGGKNKDSFKYAGSNNWRDVMNISMPFRMGVKKPNSLGIDGMSMGPEWCRDLYSVTYYSESAGATNPHEPESAEMQYLGNGEWSKPLLERVQRGGNYYAEVPENTSMVYARGFSKPEVFEVAMGPTEYSFRVVRNAE